MTIDNIIQRGNSNEQPNKAISVIIRDTSKETLEAMRDSNQLADSDFYIDNRYYGIVDVADDSWWTEGEYRNGRVIIEPVPAPCKVITRENGVQSQFSIRVLLQKPIDPEDSETIDKYILLWEQIGNVIRQCQMKGISFTGAMPAVGEDGVPLLYLGIRDNMFVAQSDFLFTVVQR